MWYRYRLRPVYRRKRQSWGYWDAKQCSSKWRLWRESCYSSCVAVCWISHDLSISIVIKCLNKPRSVFVNWLLSSLLDTYNTILTNINFVSWNDTQAAEYACDRYLEHGVQYRLLYGIRVRNHCISPDPEINCFVGKGYNYWKDFEKDIGTENEYFFTIDASILWILSFTV